MGFQYIVRDHHVVWNRVYFLRKQSAEARNVRRKSSGPHRPDVEWNYRRGGVAELEAQFDGGDLRRRARQQQIGIADGVKSATRFNCTFFRRAKRAKLSSRHNRRRW